VIFLLEERINFSYILSLASFYAKLTMVITMQTTIYLIRHSKTLKYEEEPTNTKIDQLKNEALPLSENGEKLALKLSKIEELQNIDKLYSSHYNRAILTAKHIAKQNNIEINIDKRLGERKLRRFKCFKRAW